MLCVQAGLERLRSGSVEQAVKALCSTLGGFETAALLRPLEKLRLLVLQAVSGCVAGTQRDLRHVTLNTAVSNRIITLDWIVEREHCFQCVFRVMNVFCKDYGIAASLIYGLWLFLDEQNIKNQLGSTAAD